MIETPPRRRFALGRRGLRSAVALSVGTLVVAATLLALVASPAAATTGAPVPVPAVTGTPFAARAGYDGAYAGEAIDEHPVHGAVSALVTFDRPLNRSAFAAAVRFFQGQGLNISWTDPDRLSFQVLGSPSAVGTAFGTTLRAGTYHGTPVRFPTAPPALPTDLQSEVAGVLGLSAGFTNFSFSLAPAAATGGTGPAANANTMTPADARQFYQLSELYNLSGGAATYPSALSLAVVLWGNGYVPSDIATFLADDYPASFPSPNIDAEPVAGAPEPGAFAADEGDARAVEELTLDIEWSVSMAPGATIYAVYAPNGPKPQYSPSTENLTIALAKAISLDPSVISMSFGAPESSDGSLRSSWEPYFEQAATDNITVLAATGDTGGDATLSGTTCGGGASPEYPSTDPQVIAVGGTNVTITRGIGTVSYSETGWSGSGGGFSTQFSAPSWQEQGSAAGPISANGHRGIPDISATAADNFLYFNGSNQVAEGTSFATPLWAGLVTSMDAKLGANMGFFTPNLYHVGAEEESGAIGKGLADVVGGSNCVGSATTGWDVVTGWGSPRAPVLYDDLFGSFVNIALNLPRTSVAPGGTIPVSAVLTNRSSGKPIVGVPLDLSIHSDTDLGPCTGTFSTADPVTNATGGVSATLSVPLCYLGQHADINASVTTTKLYGTAGEKVGVNLFGDDPALEALSRPPWAYVTYAVIVGAASILGAWIGRPREPSRPGPPAGARGIPTAGPPSPATPSPAASPPAPAPTAPSTPASAPPPPPPSPAPSAPAPPPAPEPTAPPASEPVGPAEGPGPTESPAPVTPSGSEEA